MGNDDAKAARPRRLDRDFYETELRRLQIELGKLQEWVRDSGARVAVIFEGRDAAGKGGVIRRITDKLSHRICRVVALGTPSDRERNQWYFQRYVAELPAKGEIVLFDRSWYNRAGVERVMGFCSDEEYEQFLHDCPIFERLLVGSGLLLRKYWLSVSDQEQERRFQARLDEPTKRWKLSPMDLASRERWVEYSRARDVMLARTHAPSTPWHVLEADDKRRTRLGCIRHLLDSIPYDHVDLEPVVLGPRPPSEAYERPPLPADVLIPDYYGTPD